jgi:hypothetical protein
VVAEAGRTDQDEISAANRDAALLALTLGSEIASLRGLAKWLAMFFRGA